MALFRRHTRHGTTTDTTTGAERSRQVTLASATLVGRTQIRRTTTATDWQDEIWNYFDTVGELRYACRWLANAISRCTLFIGQAPDGTSEPAPAEPDEFPEAAPARQVLADLHYGQVGQAEMLRRMAIHLSVPGESYLVGLDPQPDQGITHRRWYVVSNDEIKVSNRGDTRLTLPDTGQTVNINASNSTIIRVWIPHARRGWEPDSPVRATIPALREIKGLSDHISASVDSRLAGAGVLAVPHSATTPTPSQSDPGNDRALHEDPFTASLMEAMLTPISDRDDASAVVPIVVKVPDEAVGKIQHLTFATEMSTSVSDLRKDAISRFAGGADLPGEVITGMGSANHWSAWALEESSIKLHVEPLVAVICDALTQEYLWPTLEALGDPDPTRWVVWYSSAELVQRPNRSAEAQSLYDKGVLSREAVLRENGFSPEDAPGQEELEQWMATRLALSNPDLLSSLMPIINGQTPSNSNTSPPGGETNTGPNTLPEPPTELSAATPPDQPVESTWWLRAVEQVALRALELSGKRMLSRSQRGWRAPAAHVHPWDVHTVATRPDTDQLDRLLDGAYDTAQVNFADAPCVLESIDAYCRHLLTTGQPHRREYLATILLDRGCAPDQTHHSGQEAA